MISASNATQYKPQSTKLKPRKHQQLCVPNWAVRSRATYFPSGPQSRNLKQHVFRFFSETHSASQNRTRGGETMECNVGVDTASRLQSWQVLVASPPVRHLDPRNYITVWAQGCVHCKNEPIIEFSVGFEPQISSHSF